MQNNELNPVTLLASAFDPAESRETRRIRASRLMTGDRIMLKPGDEIRMNRGSGRFNVKEAMFPVVHSVKATMTDARVLVNLMNGNGEKIGQIDFDKKELIVVSCQQASLIYHSGLPECVTSISHTVAPGIGRVWHVFNGDQKIGEIWGHESGAWHCWAMRDTTNAALKNIDACLAFIAGIYNKRLNQDNSARAALLSVMRD